MFDIWPCALKVTGPESVEVTWTPPEQPNGVVTGYELRRDDEVVYVGPETHYHDFTLLPNVGYSYVVVANNSQGAVSSAAAIAKTHPSAPSGVGPPTLQPLGPSQVSESSFCVTKPLTIHFLPFLLWICIVFLIEVLSIVNIKANITFICIFITSLVPE